MPHFSWRISHHSLNQQYFFYTGKGRVKYMPWEPNKSEVQLLKENKKKIKVEKNSFIGELWNVPQYYGHQLKHATTVNQLIALWMVIAIRSVVYQATVMTEGNKPAETCVSLTENSVETRYTNHKSSFRDPNKRLRTELCKHIWHLKDTKIEFNVTWKILKSATLFNPASNRLCEKYFIICRPDLGSLNKRNELVTSLQACMQISPHRLYIFCCHAIVSDSYSGNFVHRCVV